jgi:hypothetical protein
MLKKIFTILIPLLLAALEYFHPHSFIGDVYHNLTPHLDLWLMIHVVQLALFGGVAVVFFLMIQGIPGIAANLTRFFIWAFAVSYTAYDAIAGIATGSLIRIGVNFPSEDQGVVSKMIQQFYTDPIYGGTHSIVSETASFAALLAVWGCAMTLWMNSRCAKLPLVLYFIAGPILWYSHAYPYGPTAFGLIFVANLLLAFTGRKKSAVKGL